MIIRFFLNVYVLFDFQTKVGKNHDSDKNDVIISVMSSGFGCELAVVIVTQLNPFHNSRSAPARTF